MKKCSRCKIDKELSEYNKNKSKPDGLQTFCRECAHEKFKDYYESNKDYHKQAIYDRRDKLKNKSRAFLVDYFQTHSCVDCQNSDIRVLEFDHLGNKIKGVGRLVAEGYSLEVIKEEISKCEVRCRNCHQIKTFERMGGTWHDQYLTTID